MNNIDDWDAYYDICCVCGWVVMFEDQHYPHDKNCQDRENCECDNVTCENCCWECGGNEKTCRYD